MRGRNRRARVIPAGGMTQGCRLCQADAAAGAAALPEDVEEDVEDDADLPSEPAGDADGLAAVLPGSTEEDEERESVR